MFDSAAPPAAEDQHHLAVDPVGYPQISALRATFSERLKGSGVALSSREMEVCIALLMGRTTFEIASQMSVSSSTVETYTKRATSKLGVRGRHGLARWMIGEPSFDQGW